MRSPAAAPGEVADSGDPAVAHADVASTRAVLVDDGPARQNEVESLRP